MYLRHESCPQCGSRDNLARYDDGGAFCFGCHYRERATHAPMRHMGSTTEQDEWQERAIKPLPDDINHEFNKECIEWLASFHVDVPTAIRNELVWSPGYEQLIYQLGNCWQARNFNPARKARRKNYTSGDVNECLHIYDGAGRDQDPERPLVIVEDPLSAMRIGALLPSMPLLGSSLAAARLNAVAGLYDSLVVWLDSDKYKEACSISQRAKYMGLSTRTIWTELDPKCYTTDKLREILSVPPHAT